MSQKEFPAYPPFPSVRLATDADVARIAYVSVLSFKDSEIFRYERPRYEEFPQDAITSFANLYRSRLRHRRAVVIVAEDWPRSDEGSHQSTYNDNKSDPDDTLARPIVVGAASWLLPEGSPRTDQFIQPHVSDPEPAPDRDLCQRRFNLFTRTTEVAENKYFSGMSICDKLVVHPAYRRRGHATTMLQWALYLSDMDKVDQGVIPSHMGEAVYLGLGFKTTGEIHIPSDGEIDGFSQRVLVYRANDKGLD